MKGYKGMNLDMTCLGMKYKVGETYYVNGDIELCKNGLHFCEKLVDVFDYYPKNKSRFFYVKPGEYVKTNDKKSVTSKLTILSEVPEKEVNRAFYSHRHSNGKSCGDGGVYYVHYGDGCIYGYGDGYGYGNGYGNCYGDGYGNGSGNYKGNGIGYGYDDGYGREIQKILIFR